MADVIGAFEWIGRWGRHGGTLGLTQEGEVVMGLLEGDLFADPVANDMATELRADLSLYDGLKTILAKCTEEPDA